jgi:hypothetical protein
LAPNRRVQARLHELSVSGGLLHLEDELPEGTTLMLLFDTRDGLVKETAELLAPQWATKGCLQPFRFTDPADRSIRRLQQSVQYLLERKS